MAYGKSLEEIKVKNKTVEQEVVSEKADAPAKKSSKKSKAERKAREAEEKRLKDIEVKSK